MTTVVQHNDNSLEPGTKDEPTFKNLLAAIWETRKYVLLVGILVALSVAGVLFLLRGTLPVEQVFQSQIAFTFDGVENRKYPNGTDFNLNDLIAPAILGKVYRDNALSKRGIEFDEFVSQVSIIPFSLSLQNVIARFQQRLADKKLTLAERLVIENEQKNEIEKLQNQSALVRLTVVGPVGISREMGEKIVTDIPLAWSEISIENRGVLRSERGFDSVALVNDELFNSLDQIVAIDLLGTSLGRIIKRLDEIQTINGARVIVDKESGYTLGTLRRAVSDLRAFRLKELSIVTLNFGLSKSPERTKLYFTKKLDDLLQDQARFKLTAESTKLSMLDYIRESGTAVSVNQSGGGQNGLPGTGGGTTIAQYGDAFLDKIIGLTQQSSDQKFRQKLTEERLDFLKNEIQLNAEIKNTREIIAKLSQTSIGSGNTSSSKYQENKKYVENSLIEVVAQLNRLWKIAGRLHDQLSRKQLSYSGALYRDMVLPSSRAYISNHPVLNTRVLILALALVLAAIFFTILAGLLRQIIKNKT